jgi:glycosyltransferase domain-containing protein
MSVTPRLSDPAIFSVVIPNLNGTSFLRRALDYLRDNAFPGQIVLCDSSSGEHRRFVAGCADRYDDLWIETHQYDENIRFLDKLVATLEKIDSRYVMLHANDDFMVPAAVGRCVEFLIAHPDHAAARGRVAMFALSTARGLQRGEVPVSLIPHPMRAYPQADAAERVIAHVENYASTFYSVHERKGLIESFRLTEAATKNVIFFQYLSSCLTALQGRIHCAEELFYIRQGHGDSWSSRLKRGDYEHWPLLITSPDFSRHYQDFRSALCAQVARKTGLAAAEFGPRLDNASLGLFRRSFCGVETDNPAEVQFHQRLHAAGSDEARLLSAVVHYCVKHAGAD